MAYVPSFKNDIFVSYCHDDDYSFGGKSGWVSDFHEGLERRLKQILGSRKTSVFLDKERLSGEAVLDETIRAELETAVLLAVVSPLYLSSPYCRDEREWFLEQAQESLRVGTATRALRAVKTPREDNAHRQVFDEGLGFEFFQTISKDPFRFAEFPFSSQQFGELMERLCQGLARLLEAMRRERSAVYLARCAEACQPERQKLLDELTAQGYRVLPEIEVDKRNVEPIAKEGIEEAELSIHLLDAEPDDLSVRQAEIAMDLEMPVVAWAHGERVHGSRDYGEFLDRLMGYQDPERRSQFLQRTRLERVKAEVLGLLRPFEALEKKQKGGTRAVYILCDGRVPPDYQSARKMRDWIVEKDRFRVELPSTEPLDPSELRELHKTKLRNSDGVLLYWGQASPGWFEATKHDLDARDYMSEAIGVGNRERMNIHGRMVLPLYGDFGYQDLDPFLKPLRQ